jgi:hypothetical protein
MTDKRNASIVAATVEVHCPHCGGLQPTPVGSLTAPWTRGTSWIPSQVFGSQGPRKCDLCNEIFVLDVNHRISPMGRCVIVEGS